MNRFIFIKIMMLICMFNLYSDKLDIGLSWQRNSNIPIKKLQVFSERCSGSNYIEVLLKKNFTLEDADYGWKHGSVWYELPKAEFKGPQKWYDFADSDDCLIVVIFRNPYDWVRSFYQNQHHVAAWLKELSFKKWVSSKWEEDELDHSISLTYNPYLYKNPKTKDFFKNVLQLRTEKIINMLMIKDRAKNVYYVNYERVFENPEEFIAEISKLYELQAKSNFSSVSEYKGFKDGKTYKKHGYKKIDIRTKLYINSQLNSDVEKSIGYELKLFSE